jgi:hypothetical protein
MLNVSCYANQWPKINFFFLNHFFQAISNLLVINVSCIGYQKDFLLFSPPPPPPNFFWWSQIGDHPQEGLAKFGYRPYMKGIFFKKPFTFRLHARAYCWNLASHFFSPKTRRIRAIFSPKKIYKCQNHILSGRKMWEFAPKKTLPRTKLAKITGIKCSCGFLCARDLDYEFQAFRSSIWNLYVTSKWVNKSEIYE